jgi:hypothetical protein
VGVEEPGVTRVALDGLRPDESGDRRAQPVGADDESAGQLAGPAAPLARGNAGNASARIAQHARSGDLGEHVGAGVAGRVGD